MALAELIFSINKTTIGLVELDCSVSETHIDDVEITEHPVEDGSVMSDHVRKLPSAVEINGVVTNTPVIFLASVQAKSPVKDDLGFTQDRVERAYKKLREVQEKGELVEVSTSLRTYQNMAITSLSVVRDAEKGNVLDVSISLREIRKASSLILGLPSPLDVANNAAEDAGKVQKKAETAKKAEKAQSMLSKALSLAGL